MDPKATTTAQKLKYSAEVNVIKSKLGNLEEIRNQLGLSRRKMSQLLMVDPSAWTRWANGKTKPPAHIFRALQWYMALIEKNGEWHPQNSFMRAFQPSNATAIEQSLKDYESKIDKKIIAIQYESLLSSKKNKKYGQITIYLSLALMAQSLFCLFLMLK